MTLLTRAAAPTIQMHGVTFSSFVSSASGARTLAAWQAEFPPNTAGTAHTMTEEEVLYVVSGELEVDVEGSHHVARAGDAVLVPSGALLTVNNATAQPARAWVTTLLGMRADIPGVEGRIAPPWAQ